jgi:hypothetical protein
MKHVEVNYHFIRERVAPGLLDIQFISTSDQVSPRPCQLGSWKISNTISIDKVVIEGVVEDM